MNRDGWGHNQYGGGIALVADSNGERLISREDCAVAMLGETKGPQHHRKRFRIAY